MSLIVTIAVVLAADVSHMVSRCELSDVRRIAPVFVAGAAAPAMTRAPNISAGYFDGRPIRDSLL